MGVLMGASDTDTITSLAGRLARLSKQLDADEQAKIKKAAKGVELNHLVKGLLDAVDADMVEAKALELAEKAAGEDPGDEKRKDAQEELVKAATNVFNGELIELIDTIRRGQGPEGGPRELGRGHQRGMGNRVNGERTAARK